jgi:hypothetical protein
MSTAEEHFPVHADPRGELLAVEGADVGFPVARVFTVRGSAERLPRGGHTADCRELLVLVSGRAQGTVLRAGSQVAFDLASPGDAFRVAPSDFIDYTLDADSVLLVLCDRPFEARP